MAHRHQFLSRIRNTRCSCIRDQRNLLSLLHQTDQIMTFIDLVIFMITGHRRRNLKMIQQFDTVSRILRRDQIYFF